MVHKTERKIKKEKERRLSRKYLHPIIIEGICSKIFLNIYGER